MGHNRQSRELIQTLRRSIKCHHVKFVHLLYKLCDIIFTAPSQEINTVRRYNNSLNDTERYIFNRLWSHDSVSTVWSTCLSLVTCLVTCVCLSSRTWDTKDKQTCTIIDREHSKIQSAYPIDLIMSWILSKVVTWRKYPKEISESSSSNILNLT